MKKEKEGFLKRVRETSGIIGSSKDKGQEFIALAEQILTGLAVDAAKEGATVKELREALNPKA